MGPINELIGIAIGLAVLSVVAGLSILSSGTSNGLISAVGAITSFIGLIGLGIAVGLLNRAFHFA
jgi:hypothetical protein